MLPLDPPALIDARLGRKPSGIGYYVMNLATQFARLAPREVRPICRARQLPALRRLGLRPVLRERTFEAEGLPAAAVVHGPNFHALDHPAAARVATIHDLGFLHLPECHPPSMPERLDALIRKAEPTTALFLCDSEWTRQDFMDHYGVSDDRCRTVHLGVAERYGRAHDSAKLTRRLKRLRIQRPYLLHVGAMVPRKDLRTLLAAFELVAAAGSDLTLVLAGHKTRRWASDWDHVRTYLQERPHLHRRIRVLNYVRDSDMPMLYAGAAACVSTSLLEGFGLTVLEGLASGRPVVATRGSAISEIADDVVYFGEARQPETYAGAITAALRQTEPQADAGRRVASRYTWESTAQQTLQAYRDACQG